jgi:MoxR-like ATPase
MEERQVTLEGTTRPLPNPFLVIATQNPIDLEGTYQLPEAQLDRFLMRLSLGYADLDTETAILAERAHAPVPMLRPVTTLEQVSWLQQAAAGLYVAPELTRYVALLAAATRTHEALRLGVSTRGSLALIRAAQAFAAGLGRHYVVPDDLKTVAGPVLTHRLVLTAAAQVRGGSAAQVLADVLSTVPVPVLVR